MTSEQSLAGARRRQ